MNNSQAPLAPMSRSALRLKAPLSVFFFDCLHLNGVLGFVYDLLFLM